MSDKTNVEDSSNIVNAQFERDKELQKIREEVLKKFQEYKKTIAYMAADAPIEILCLPKTIEGILLREGFLRVYDLFNCDFTKIKGFGDARIRDLTACLDKFFSML